MKKPFKALTCLALTFCMLTSNLLSANAAAAATTTASTAPITVSKKNYSNGGWRLLCCYPHSKNAKFNGMLCNKNKKRK